MITMALPGPILVFNNVIFRHNVYNILNPPPITTSHAILSQGGMQLTNTCWMNNDFRGDAPIIALATPIITQNNYQEGVDEGIDTCPFIMNFFTRECTNFDADTCMAVMRDANGIPP